MNKLTTIAAMLWLMLVPAAYSSAAGSPLADIELSIRKSLIDNRYDYLISISAIPTTVPENYDSLRIEMVGESQPFGNCWFKTYFYQNQTIAQTVTLNAQVQWYEESLVSARSIPRGEVLVPDMFTMQRREMTSLTDPAVTSLDEIEGQEAARTIAQGKSLTYSMIKPEELVKRGDQVTIVCNMGSLHITATGEARQSGSRGESIKVKNLSTNKIITAEVQDEQLVKVVR